MLWRAATDFAIAPTPNLAPSVGDEATEDDVDADDDDGAGRFTWGEGGAVAELNELLEVAPVRVLAVPMRPEEPALINVLGEKAGMRGDIGEEGVCCCCCGWYWCCWGELLAGGCVCAIIPRRGFALVMLLMLMLMPGLPLLALPLPLLPLLMKVLRLMGDDALAAAAAFMIWRGVKSIDERCGTTAAR